MSASAAPRPKKLPLPPIYDRHGRRLIAGKAIDAQSPGWPVDRTPTDLLILQGYAIDPRTGSVSLTGR